MAPSSNYTLHVALLVAFAVVAPSLLHQSAAARDGGAAKAAAAPAPSVNDDGEVVLHPTATTIEIPDLPLPRILPCPPAFPKIPFIPCHNVTPPPPPPRPKECRPSLVTLMPPCSGFLTANSSSASAPKDPSKKCCEGVNRFAIHSSGDDASIYDPYCLCHVVNGDVNQLLTAPVDHARALSLLQACFPGIDPNQFSDVCNDLRDKIPPMELPKPPTPAPGNKA